MSKIVQELKGMTVEQLHERLEQWRRDLFMLRLNVATSHVKDYTQFKKLRANIARGLTVLRQQAQ